MNPWTVKSHFTDRGAHWKIDVGDPFFQPVLIYYEGTPPYNIRTQLYFKSIGINNFMPTPINWETM